MRVSTIVENRMSPVSQLETGAKTEVKSEVTCLVTSSRPGPKAAISDDLLSNDQLEKRNKIRQRNKEAAQRVRDRRVQKVKNLEDLVAALERKNKILEMNNQYLQATVVAQNKQLEMQLASTRQMNFHRQISNTELPSENDFVTVEKTPEANVQIFSNGKGQGGILMTHQTAFILSPLHQLQISLNSSPQKPQNLNELQTFLDAM